MAPVARQHTSLDASCHGSRFLPKLPRCPKASRSLEAVRGGLAGEEEEVWGTTPFLP